MRKGVGRITLLDHDIVEASNLNRQRFYEQDLCKNKPWRWPRTSSESALQTPRSEACPGDLRRLSFVELISHAMLRFVVSITTQRELQRADTSALEEFR